MVKKLFFAAVVAAFGMTACQKTEGLDAARGGVQTFTVSTSLPAQMQQTRSAGDGKTVNRCIMEVYLDGAQYGERQVVAVDNLTANFSVRLVAGKSYDFVFWADKHGDALEDDLYYNTASLEAVTLAGAYMGNNDEFDAFFASEKVTAEATKAINVELRRPFGQLNVKTLDMKEVADAASALVPKKVSVKFDAVPSGINLLTGELLAENVAMEYQAPAELVNNVNNAGELTVDYIFAPKGTEQFLADFTMSFLAEDGTTEVAQAYSFNAIPVQRNYRTMVSGNILTKKADVSVEVKPGFDGDIDREAEEVHSVNEIVEAVKRGVTDIEVANELAEQVDLSQLTIEEDLVFTFDGDVTIGGQPVNFIFPESYDKTVTIVDGSDNGADICLDIKADGAKLVIADATVDYLATTADVVEIYGDVMEFGALGSETDVYWGAGDGARLREVMGKDAAYNDGIILTADADLKVGNGTDGTQPGQDVFAIGVPSQEYGASEYDGYVFDGRGFEISGAAYNNVMAVYANDVTVKNVVIRQTEEQKAVKANAGLSLYRVKNVKLENVTVENCGKAGVIVNAATVSAVGLKSSGNAWGGVNISKGSVPAGGEKSVFTMDETSVVADAFPVYVDLDRTGDDYEVNLPKGWVGTIVGTKAIYSAEPIEGLPYINNADTGAIYGSVAEALAAATEGQTVLVSGATCDEAISVPAGVTLDGSNNSVFSNKIVLAAGSTLRNLKSAWAWTRELGMREAIRVDAANTTLENLEIVLDGERGGDDNVIAVTSSMSATGLTVKNCEFTNYWKGLYINVAEGLKIEGSKFNAMNPFSIDNFSKDMIVAGNTFVRTSIFDAQQSHIIFKNMTEVEGSTKYPESWPVEIKEVIYSIFTDNTWEGSPRMRIESQGTTTWNNTGITPNSFLSGKLYNAYNVFTKGDRHQPSAVEYLAEYEGEKSSLYQPVVKYILDKRTAWENRDVTYQGHFYNTQGRHFEVFNPENLTKWTVEGKIYVDAKMVADKKPFRSELWTAARNAETNGEVYPMMGIANVVEDTGGIYQSTVDKACVRIWIDNGWVNVEGVEVSAGWHTVEMESDGSNVTYKFDNAVVGQMSTTNVPVRLLSVMPQAFHYDYSPDNGKTYFYKDYTCETYFSKVSYLLKK